MLSHFDYDIRRFSKISYFEENQNLSTTPLKYMFLTEHLRKKLSIENLGHSLNVQRVFFLQEVFGNWKHMASVNISTGIESYFQSQISINLG